MIDWKKLYSSAADALKRINVELDVKMPIKYCTTAQKQLVEIAKAIYWNARIIILDEPTSALNADETEKMLTYIHKLAKEQNVCIVFITHHLDEIFEIADKVAVLRDGCHITTLDVAKTTNQELIYHMVGRKLNDMYPKANQTFGDVIMECKGLTNDYVRNISFSIRRGEILGVYGLMGSGHIELGQMLFGDYPAKSGEYIIAGKKVSLKNPIDALKNGFAYVPSERKTEGLVLQQTVVHNVVVAHYQYIKDKLVNYKYDSAAAKKWIERLRIKTPSAFTPVESLSGGNQQKVVLAKLLARDNLKIYIFDEPTRGIDVGAKSEIYKLISEFVKNGIPSIVISSEIPEIQDLCDRVIVMSEGHITEVLDREQLKDADLIMKYAIASIDKAEGA